MKVTLFHNDLPADLNITGDIAIDTETMGLSLVRDRLCLLQISNGDGDAYLVQFSNRGYDAPNLKKMLLDENKGKIFHYARFDLAIIRKHFDIELKNVFCTKIASRLVRTYTEFHSLKDLCKEFLGINISKKQQSSYWGTDTLSEEQKEYAAKDVIYLHSLREILVQRLIKEDKSDVAHKIFEFLSTRVSLDLMGWDEEDIFSHGIK